MSNSGARLPEVPSFPPLAHGLRVKLIGVLCMAFAVELCSRLITGRGTEVSLLAEAMSVVAVLLACASIGVLVSRTRGSRAVRGFMLIAGSAFLGAILLRLFEEIPALDAVPLLGSRGTLHQYFYGLTDLAGITAWVFGFFWLVFDLESTRESLNAQRQRLLQEIDERNRAEVVLRESEGRFRAVFDNVPASILVMTTQGKLIECNRALAAELGYSLRQLHDTGLETLVHEDDRTAFRVTLESIQAGTSAVIAPFQTRLICRDTSALHFSMAATLVRPDTRQAGIVVAVLENVSERILRDQQIQRRQKMESLEILAGGVAHDFNNLLVGVMANADHLARKLDANPENQQICLDIVQSAQNAADLCQQLLAYAGKAPRHEEPINVTQLVENSAQLLRVALGHHAALVIQGTPGLPAVSADPAHLRQVLLSLIANASDALTGDAGTITVSTGIEVLQAIDFSRMLHQHTATPGSYVYLEVADTGSGISEEALSRIFDPFYSTKRHGSGLGLAAVLGIVHAHKGLLAVHSTPKQGTCFRIYLPPTAQEAAPVVAESTQEIANVRPAPGTLVLVVDDEEIVRNAAQRILEHSGYEVLTAVDGQEGVEIFEARHADLSAVLLDLTMPRMNGETACARMREIAPNVPIILSSGYSENESSSPAIFREVAAYIRKPYRLKQLLDILREVT